MYIISTSFHVLKLRYRLPSRTLERRMHASACAHTHTHARTSTLHNPIITIHLTVEICGIHTINDMTFLLISMAVVVGVCFPGQLIKTGGS